MVYSNQPLPPFADEETVDASTSHVLPDIFPVAPTMDLRKQHVWRPENITGKRSVFAVESPGPDLGVFRLSSQMGLHKLGPHIFLDIFPPSLSIATVPMKRYRLKAEQQIH